MSKKKETYYITVTSGLRGYFAVLIAQETETGFCEPVQTSPFSYNNYKKARQDAEIWAKAEGLPLK